MMDGADQPSANQLLDALESAHNAGDTGAATEFAAWHQELYGESEPQQQPIDTIEPSLSAKIDQMAASPEGVAAIEKGKERLGETTAFGAGAFIGTLGMAEAEFRTPEAAGRLAGAASEGIEALGLPRWLNPVRAIESTADFLAEGKVPGTDITIGGASNIADRISDTNKELSKSGAFKRIADKSRDADLAFDQALDTGDLSGVFQTMSDPEAWAGFVGQAAPSLISAYLSGGSLPFIAWLESMEVASDAADFEKRTGQKIEDGDFTKAVGQVALVNTFLEKFGLDQILKASKGKVLSSMLKKGVSEYGTEWAQNFSTNLAVFLNYDETKSLTEGGMAAGMGGFGAGAAGGGAVAISERAGGRKPMSELVSERLQERGVSPEAVTQTVGQVFAAEDPAQPAPAAPVPPQILETEYQVIEDVPRETDEPKPGIQKVSTKGLKVRRSDIDIAEENIAKGKPSVTPDDPVEVTYNRTTGEYELADGYHRYLALRGGSIDEALNKARAGDFPEILADVKIVENVERDGFTVAEEVESKPSQETIVSKTEPESDISEPTIPKTKKGPQSEKQIKAEEATSEAEKREEGTKAGVLGSKYKTGDPVKLFFSKNLEKAPKDVPGMDFGQEMEPSGDYVVVDEKAMGTKAEGAWRYGEVEFKNPLVLEHKTTSSIGWKKDASEMFGGKTGKALESAIKNSGYDGIITVDKYHRDPGYVLSEAVILGAEKKEAEAKPKKKTGTPVTSAEFDEIRRKKAAKKKPADTKRARTEERDTLSSMEMAAGYDQPMPQWWPTFRTTGVPPRPPGGFFKIGDKHIDLKPEDKPTRREGVRVMITDIIGPRLYQGKIKGNSRLGHYSQTNSEVRIAHYDDVEVMAHELAHFLDFHHAVAPDFKKAYTSSEFKSEVEDLSYTSREENRAKEGFAEFTRLWLTNYRKSKELAPKFTEEFESIISEDKKLNKKLIKLQEEMHRWYRQGELGQLYAVISGNQYTASQTVAKVLQQRPMELARQHWIDKIHAAKVIGRSIHGEMLDAGEDSYKQLQLLNGVEGIVHQSFEKGALVFDEEGAITFQGPSMNEIWGESIKKGPARIREQEAYFAARRASELKSQKRENLISSQMIESGLRLGRKYPQFKNFFTMYQQYRKNMMEFYVDSGYLDKAAAENMLNTNKNYVPFNREIEKTDGKGAGSGGFMRLRGGTQNIKPILENMLSQDARHIQQALKTRALRKLYSDALRSQDGSLFVSRLSPDSKIADKRIVESVKGDTVNRIAEVLADSGQMVDEGGNVVPLGVGDVVSIQDIENALEKMPGIMNFWTHGHKPKTTETMVDSFIDYDGKLVWFEIQKENKILADMLDNMDSVALPENVLGTAVKMAMAVKRFQTLTITSMFQFAGPNIIRDQQQAFALSGGKYKPIWGVLAGYHGMIKAIFDKNSAYHEMQAQGGPTGGRVRVQMDDTYGPEFVPDAVARPFYYPAQMMKGLLDTYISVMDSPEMATRLGFYIRMRKEVGAREAAFQAREISTDFKKHGSYAAWVLLQRTVPFFGAYVQSIDRDIRALAEKDGEMSVANLVKTESGRLKLDDLKVKIWMASSLMITIPMLLAVLNDDEEKYEALTADQKSRFYHAFINGEHYTIPKPHGFMSLAGTAGEVAVDYINDKVGKDAADTILFASAYHFGADAMPGLINPIFELMVNKKFTGAPIINGRLRAVDPQYQYSDRTPLLYIGIGEKLGVSPEVANHLVKGYTGYLSDYMSSASEAALWDTKAWGERPFVKDVAYLATKQFNPSKVPYRTKWTVNYYELKKRAAAKEASLRLLTSRAMIKKEGPAKYITDRVNSTLIGINGAFKEIDKAFKDQRTIIAAIKYNPKLSAKEKERKIESWYTQKNKVYQAAYKQLESELAKVERDLSK